MHLRLPNFSDLPLNKDDPPYSAWGLYGKADQLGFLNRLSDDVVLEASQEIRSGKRISLNWALNAQSEPFFGRQPFEQSILDKSPRCVNDDIWHFNTQSSSQWDGLRHFAYQKERKFYNGITQEDIHGHEGSTVNGIQAWAEQGIVGRGVLLDYEDWRLEQGLSSTPFETSPIKLQDLKEVAKRQNVEFKFGDILIIRSGYMAAFNQLSSERVHQLAEIRTPNLVGVEQSEDVLEWIWNNFSAVAGDQPAFEQWPTQREFSLHEVLLSGWGCPIGELFEVEALSKHCKETGRYSFFIASEVCNVPGGVASPPNILAIF